MNKEIEILLEKKNTLSKKFRKSENDTINFAENFISELKNILLEKSIECEIKLDGNKINLIFPSNSFYSKNITIDYTNNNLYLRIPSFNLSKPEMDSNNLHFGKVVVFLSEQFINEENDFIKNIKNNIKKNYKNIIDLNSIKREISSIDIKINDIETKIKKENFFNNLKNGNFYYSYVESRYTTNYYDVFYIKKINNKTCNIVRFKARNENDIKLHIDNIENYPQKRVKKDELFHYIHNWDIFYSDNYKEVILKYNIKNNIQKIYKQKNLDTIKDIKKLCNILFKVNAIDKSVPDNDTLSIISENRHQILKYGFIK